jgi:methyltransferase (TIGR00027 family)
MTAELSSAESANGRLSYTACNVIACLMALHKSKTWSFLVSKEDSQFYEACMEIAQKHSFVVRLFKPFPSVVAGMMEMLFAKGIAQHFALRKAAIRRLVLESYRGGVTQCVVLGGGFDINAYRLATQNANLRVCEVDRSYMHKLKIEALQKEYGAFPSNFVGVAADLANDRLEDVLRSVPGFEPEQKTVFVAEGVLMYLGEEGVTNLLHQIKTITPAGSQFVFTSMGRNPKVDQGMRSRFGDFFLYFYGETLSFGIDSTEIESFLEKRSFQVDSIIDRDALSRAIAMNEQSSWRSRVSEYIVAASSL